MRARTLRSAAIALVWILGLSGCGGDSSAPTALPTPTPASTAPTPAPVPAAWENWIRANHYPLRSIQPTDTDFSDLRFLKQIIGDRRLVQLGESGHGVAEFDSAKVRLIRFLHEEMDFDVIAFESGLYECFRADENAVETAPIGTMRSSIFGVWWTDETLPLFEYLQQTKSTDHPLTLAGFDVQISSSRGVDDRPETLYDVLGVIDAEAASHARDLDRLFIQHDAGDYSSFQQWLRSEGDGLIAKYEEVAAFLRAKQGRLISTFPDRPLLPLVLRQSITSMPAYIKECRTTSSVDASNVRDLGMADNVDVLLSELYPGKKVMVWAHNWHIRHRGDVQPGIHNMGFWVAQRHRAELYSVGLFMNRGEAAMNDRSVYVITPGQAGSLEALFAHTETRYCVVDMLHAEPSDGTAWMFNAIPVREWGYIDDSIVPREQYDGILFVEYVHPPHYR